MFAKCFQYTGLTTTSLEGWVSFMRHQEQEMSCRYSIFIEWSILELNMTHSRFPKEASSFLNVFSGLFPNLLPSPFPCSHLSQCPTVFTTPQIDVWLTILSFHSILVLEWPFQSAKSNKLHSFFTSQFKYCPLQLSPPVPHRRADFYLLFPVASILI